MTHPVCCSLCTKSTQITICRISHELDPEALARARPVYQRSLASSQKGQISLRCCCQNSFCSPPPKKKTPRVSSLSTHAHASRGAHSITPLASLPQRIGDLWGLAGFVKRWLPSRVVTATFVFQGSSQWCEEREKKKEKHGRVSGCEILCCKMNSCGTRLLLSSIYCVSLQLMKMHQRFLGGGCVACCHQRVVSEQAARLSVRRRRLAADDVVLFGEPAFSLPT